MEMTTSMTTLCHICTNHGIIINCNHIFTYHLRVCAHYHKTGPIKQGHIITIINQQNN